jgi:hypothetical protein
LEQSYFKPDVLRFFRTINFRSNQKHE